MLPGQRTEPGLLHLFLLALPLNRIGFFPDGLVREQRARQKNKEEEKKRKKRIPRVKFRQVFTTSVKTAKNVQRAPERVRRKMATFAP
jgi:hypothetical protein